mgnify:CR=1 FL=1
MAYSQSHAAEMKKALDTIGAELGCEGTTTEEQMLAAIANIRASVSIVAQGVKKNVQVKADKKLDKVKKELDEVKADLSKSWATISDLKTENEKLKGGISNLNQVHQDEIVYVNAKCQKLKSELEDASSREDSMFKTLNKKRKEESDWAMKKIDELEGWREKYGDLKERCDEFPTENEMGLNVCDLDEIIKVQKDENATISEELEKVKEIARRQSKWIVNAKKTIQIFEEVEEEKYCAKYCRCGTEWTKEKGDKYCKSCSGR